MTQVDILLPTCDRLDSLILTLGGIAGQSRLPLCRLIVADQGGKSAAESQVVKSLCRIIESRGCPVIWHHRPTLLGIAEQRDFLLKNSSSPFALYLDDDVFMEPWVVGRLLGTIQEQGCGFVGAFPTGLSFRNDIRPAQQVIEFWDGPVRPEVVEPGSAPWERAQLHRAANAYHVAQRLKPGERRLYKVAWVASCILYDRTKLAEVGGFEFWSRLPRYHSGEEVVVQNLLMRRWGGCAILPSGTYHSEMPSTVLNSQGTVDGHALDLLPELAAKFVPPSPRPESVTAAWRLS